MKIVFTVGSLSSQEDLEFQGETNPDAQTGLSPLHQLKSRLSGLGFHVVITRQPIALEQADIAVFWNIDKTLYKDCLSLPEQLPCLLISNQSHLDGGYNLETLSSKGWVAVLTWNRSFQAPHILHYDMPFFYDKSVLEKKVWEADVGSSRLTKSSARGVALSHAKQDKRGLIPQINSLYRELATAGHIDLVEVTGTLPQNKIETLRKYPYSLVAEEALCPGYVTKTLADSIIAGIPAIYLGDVTTAERRFPGCFVQLKDLSVDSFLQAQQELLESYDSLQQNILSVRQDSHTWGQNFLGVVETEILKIKQENVANKAEI
ncbi:MAG: hypothetical protein RID09_31215 [Coleofasciculus sp. G1-WW12-02]|uniref:hypothetical protein n=1 Tax=Coleofasciculus sp. G1-WW12-02 TaxID=3068483 RepID=UPI0032FCC49E